VNNVDAKTPQQLRSASLSGLTVNLTAQALRLILNFTFQIAIARLLAGCGKTGLRGFDLSGVGQRARIIAVL
jgi:hypothetical protein